MLWLNYEIQGQMLSASFFLLKPFNLLASWEVSTYVCINYKLPNMILGAKHQWLHLYLGNQLAGATLWYHSVWNNKICIEFAKNYYFNITVTIWNDLSPQAIYDGKRIKGQIFGLSSKAEHSFNPVMFQGYEMHSLRLVSSAKTLLGLIASLANHLCWIKNLSMLSLSLANLRPGLQRLHVPMCKEEELCVCTLPRGSRS